MVILKPKFDKKAKVLSIQEKLNIGPTSEKKEYNAIPG